MRAAKKWCLRVGGAQGCKGGDFTGGLHYIITNGGINTEESYPYVHVDKKCNRTLQEGWGSSPPPHSVQAHWRAQILHLLHFIAPMDRP